MSKSNTTLYSRLGGYDAIAAVAETLISKLMADNLLKRFWIHRGEDGLRREKQLLIDFLCATTGGPLLYTGRNMLTTHRGMGITDQDWSAFMRHVRDTLAEFSVPESATSEVVSFVESTKPEIVGI